MRETSSHRSRSSVTATEPTVTFLRDTTIGGCLRAAAAASPEVIALVDGDAPPATRTAMDLWRVLRPGRAHGACPGGAVRAGRADRGVVADATRVARAHLRDRIGRPRPRARQSDPPGSRSGAHPLELRSRRRLPPTRTPGHRPARRARARPARAARAARARAPRRVGRVPRGRRTRGNRPIHFPTSRPTTSPRSSTRRAPRARRRALA